MQSIPKSIHHTIPTLVCLALAGTLAACGGGGGGGGDGTTTGSANAPTISFTSVPANDTTSQTYAGASPGGKFTNDATVATKGKCTVLPTPTYSSPDYTSDTSKILVDVTSGEVTYKAAGSYTITASTADTTADTTSDSSVCDAASAQYTLIVNKATADLTFDSSITRRVAVSKPAKEGKPGKERKATYLAILSNTTTDLSSTAAMGGSIRYSSADTNKASVDATTGEVTAGDKTGDVRIYATYSGSANYKPVTETNRASYTLNISNAVPIITFRAQEVTADYAGANPGRTYIPQTADVTVDADSQCKAAPTPTYSSPDHTSDTSKILVDAATGQVTYKAAGTYTITATTADVTSGSSTCYSTSNSYTLTVNKATAKLTFDSTTDSVAVGEVKTIRATLRGVGDDSNDTMGGTISYYSDNTSIATVDTNSGDVTALYDGTDVTTVVIYASYSGSDNYREITGDDRARYTLHISNSAPAITFAKTSTADRTKIYAGASPGGTFANVASVAAKGKCTVPPTPSYSGVEQDTGLANPDKVEVDTSGVVTYYAAGSYTIKATTQADTSGDSVCNAASASYTLTVNKATPTIKFNNLATTVKIGETVSRNLAVLTGVGDDSTGVNDEILDGISITYSSDNTSIASVDASSGAVTGKRLSGTGGVTITATYPGSDNYKDVSGKYPLTVTLTPADLATVSSSPIKKLIFSWRDVTDAAYYRLLQVHGGEVGDTQVGDDVMASNTGGLQSITRIVPLFDTSTDTRYRLASCDSADTCVDSTNIKTITQAQLNRAIGYIKASNTDAGDEFGYAVSLSKAGTTLAVGARLEDSNASGVYNNQSEWSTMHNNNDTTDSGAVYIFSRNANGDWTQQAYIKASNTGGGDQFGQSLSLSADGATLAVGAHQEDSDATGVGNQTRWSEMNNDNTSGAGAVYVFSRTNSTSRDWTQQAYIKASNTSRYNQFGESLSLSAAGTTLAVGASQEDSNASGVYNNQGEWDAMNNNNSDPNWNAGAVYVFTRPSSTSRAWRQQAYIKASNTGNSDYFGYSLSLSAAGTTLAVGAYREGSDATGVGGSQGDGASYSGAVYVFSRDTSMVWTQDAYIKASNTGSGDLFGWSVSLSAAGTTLAVGAYSEDSSADGVGNNKARWDAMNNLSARNAGAVYVFTRPSSTSRDWTQDAYIKASNTGSGDNFGYSVSLDASGGTLAVGARHEDSDATGVGSNQTQWSAMNNDNTDDADDAGAVYVFSRDASTDGYGYWSQQAYIKASNTGSEDYFGSSVSLDASGDTLAVGARHEDSNATGTDGDGQDINSAGGAGAVYLY